MLKLKSLLLVFLVAFTLGGALLLPSGKVSAFNWTRVINGHNVTGYACRTGVTPQNGFYFKAYRNSPNARLVKVTRYSNTRYVLIDRYREFQGHRELYYTDSSDRRAVMVFWTIWRAEGQNEPTKYRSSIRFNDIVSCT